MAYLTQKALANFGFKRLGINVKISDKASIYNPELIEIGSHVRIDDFCLISGKVILGSYLHIAAFCNVAGGRKGIVMEDLTTLSSKCHVFTQSDDYSGQTLTNPMLPEIYKNIFHAPVFIKKHSIIGTNAIIFPGVTLEEGTAVGAMSLVTKSTQAWSIYCGVPARFLKVRSKNLLELEKLFLLEKRSKEAL